MALRAELKALDDSEASGEPRAASVDELLCAVIVDLCWSSLFSFLFRRVHCLSRHNVCAALCLCGLFRVGDAVPAARSAVSTPGCAEPDAAGEELARALDEDALAHGAQVR